MVLRVESVRERLLRLEEVISQLEQLRARRSGSEDYRDRWAIERGLQLGAEIVLDIGNHVLSAHFGVSARDYEDILTQLVAQQVISSALHTRLRGIGGFRNLLVHDYMRLDPAIVSEQLERAPTDFSAFSLEVRAWLESTVTR